MTGRALPHARFILEQCAISNTISRLQRSLNSSSLVSTLKQSRRRTSTLQPREEASRTAANERLVGSRQQDQVQGGTFGAAYGKTDRPVRADSTAADPVGSADRIH